MRCSCPTPPRHIVLNRAIPYYLLLPAAVCFIPGRGNKFYLSHGSATVPTRKLISKTTQKKSLMRPSLFQKTPLVRSCMFQKRLISHGRSLHCLPRLLIMSQGIYSADGTSVFWKMPPTKSLIGPAPPPPHTHITSTTLHMPLFL